MLFLVLFGAKRLPDSARALGQSLRIFKAETKGLRADDETVAPVASLAAVPPVPPVPVVAVPVAVAAPVVERVGSHRATS